MSMEDILKVLMDSRRQGTSPQQGNDPMTDLMEGILGGVQPQPGSQPAGLGDMMGLLESVIGNQGDASTATQNDPVLSMLTPLITQLAKKANISPEIAMIVASFVIHKLLAHHPSSGRDSNTFDLDDLLSQMKAGNVNPGMLQSSGMVGELSQRTGLDEPTAEKSLQLAMGLIGSTIQGTARKHSASSPTRKTGRPAKSARSRAVNRSRK